MLDIETMLLELLHEQPELLRRVELHVVDALLRVDVDPHLGVVGADHGHANVESAKSSTAVKICFGFSIGKVSQLYQIEPLMPPLHWPFSPFVQMALMFLWFDGVGGAFLQISQNLPFRTFSSDGSTVGAGACCTRIH